MEEEAARDEGVVEETGDDGEGEGGSKAGKRGASLEGE